jgi:hypothetical protein
VRLGRPSVLPATVVEHIVGKHRAGDSLRTIVSQLNHEGVPTTPRRATWY